MKKTIIILVLLTAAMIVAGAPAAIGWFVHDRLSSALAEELPNAQVDWNRGWFRSDLRVEDEVFSARLDFRHASPASGWLSVDGLVTLAEWAAAIDLDARIALDGTLSANASAPRLDVAGPVTWRYASPELALTASRRGDARLSGDADRLLIFDGIGNRLTLIEPALELRVQSEAAGEASGRLELTAQRAGQGESRLVVTLQSIDPAAFAELMQSMGQMAGAEPGSATAGLGVIGAASAWQQLVKAGLRLEIEQLVLDRALSLSGHWQPQGDDFRLTGEGRRDTLLDWWSRIAGLAGQVVPERARSASRLKLQELSDRGTVRLERDRVSVDLQALPLSTGSN